MKLDEAQVCRLLDVLDNLICNLIHCEKLMPAFHDMSACWLWKTEIMVVQYLQFPTRATGQHGSPPFTVACELYMHKHADFGLHIAAMQAAGLSRRETNEVMDTYVREQVEEKGAEERHM